ncbi:hypothetical protein GPALN_015639 [Globodera pallida]|nr:hypothetical protein GPALN_015639 [Globodera pallida]
MRKRHNGMYVEVDEIWRKVDVEVDEMWRKFAFKLTTKHKSLSSGSFFFSSATPGSYICAAKLPSMNNSHLKYVLPSCCSYNQVQWATTLSRSSTNALLNSSPSCPLDILSNELTSLVFSFRPLAARQQRACGDRASSGARRRAEEECCASSLQCACALPTNLLLRGFIHFPKLPLEKAVVEGPTCSIEVQCTDCAQKAAICAREFDPKKVLSKTPCCNKGFNMECCAKLATAVSWKPMKLVDTIKELDERNECKNEEFYCMCDAYKFENVLRSSGMCCGNGTCNCCETDPSIAALKSIIMHRNDGCDDGGFCTLSEGKPSSKCCNEHYELNSTKLDYGQLRIIGEKDVRSQGCVQNKLLFYYSPDFAFALAHKHRAFTACADKTVWGLFAQPPSSTPSKVNGVAMPPSATYASVVALVLGRFVLLPPMIYGQ